MNRSVGGFVGRLAGKIDRPVDQSTDQSVGQPADHIPVAGRLFSLNLYRRAATLPARKRQKPRQPQRQSVLPVRINNENPVAHGPARAIMQNFHHSSCIVTFEVGTDTSPLYLRVQYSGGGTPLLWSEQGRLCIQ